ncbi:MAG TPA: PAS domain-containing protein [Solirubrobacteraceae bacterium]|nr:PAS domain-containing protein [Solirubrobacteraceae bacterium]
MGQPLELILARNLMSSISTPAVLVDTDGMLIFFNDAAAALLGQRFEELGKLEWRDWSSRFGPFDRAGSPIEFEQLPLTIALREGRPAHHNLTISAVSGDRYDVEVSAMPLVSTDGGFRGAIAFFWRDGG